MNLKTLFPVLAVVLLFAAAVCPAQQRRAEGKTASASPSAPPAAGPAPAPAAASTAAQAAVRSSAAFAELVLRRADLESALEDFLASYTEDYPKVRETRYELELVRKDLARLLSLSPASEAGRLTAALGKLMVRRAEWQTAAWSLQGKYGEKHPEVLRAQRRAASFDKAVAEILP